MRTYKKARDPYSCLSRVLGLRIAFKSRTSNEETHADML